MIKKVATNRSGDDRVGHCRAEGVQQLVVSSYVHIMRLVYGYIDITDYEAWGRRIRIGKNFLNRRKQSRCVVTRWAVQTVDEYRGRAFVNLYGNVVESSISDVSPSFKVEIVPYEDRQTTS